MAASVVDLKDPSWYWKTPYDEINAYPFMNSALPMALITIAYLAFVLKIGPAFMKNRKPYELKNVLLAYNAFQIGFSAYIVIVTGKYHHKYGLAHSKCFGDNKEMRNETFYIFWVYCAAKVTELLDTVFFVLRKKSNQVSFLHVYHHGLMVVATWIYAKYFPHDSLVFLGTANGLVHVVMYGYYGLAAIPGFAKYLWWKKHITKMQLIQFAAILSHYLISVNVSECPPPKFIVYFIATNFSLFTYLFGKFYVDNYRKNADLSGKDVTIGNNSVSKKNKMIGF